MRTFPMSNGAPSWPMILSLLACLLVLHQAWRGWRLGVVRQTASLVAIVSAYAAAIFGGQWLVPWLRPLAIPDPLLAVIGGFFCGLVAFAIVSLLSALLFKKTAQQPVGLLRLGYGALGAVLGTLFGVFLVWFAVLSIRVLGTLAEADVAAGAGPPSSAERLSRVQPRASRPADPVVQKMAEMKRSLEQGAAGAVVERVDPIPDRLYSILSKLGRMFSDERSMERFITHPGIRPLAQHPKILALQADPAIARDVMSRNYLALVRNQRIVQAANDPEIGALMRDLEFEKALDFAVTTRESGGGSPSSAYRY